MSKLREPNCARPGQATHLAALAATLLAAFYLRIRLLGDQNIWWDEGLAIWAVRQGWARMTMWTASDVHPPLYFWLLKAWTAHAGESELAARFLSLGCGMVTVAALYAFARAMIGPRTALLASVLLSFSRFHVWWSQEMRMYILATMWGTLSLYALARWFRAEGWLAPRPGDTALPGRQAAGGAVAPLPAAVSYVLSSVAGLYSLYLFVTVILIENLFFLAVLLSCPDRRGAAARWIASQLAVLMPFLPWLVLAVPRMRSWSVATPFDFCVFVRLYATLLTLGISTYIERYTGLVLPFVAVIGVALVVMWRWLPLRRAAEGRPPQAGHKALLLVLFLAVPPVVVYVLTRPRSLFYTPRVEARYLVLFAPAFYLLLAWTVRILYQRARWLGVTVAALVAVTFVWTLPGHYEGRYLRDEHQTMVRVIAAYAEPGDAILLVSGSRFPIFEYYYGRLPPGSVRPLIYSLPQGSTSVTGQTVDSELSPLAAAHTRLWLAEVNAPMEDPDGLVSKWLGQHYVSPLSIGFAHNALTLYAPAAAIPAVNPGNLAPQHVVSASLGAGCRLLGYDLPTREFRPGDTARFALHYAADRETNLTVRLVDAEGRALEQRRTTLPRALPAGRQQFDFRVYSHTPAGLYQLQLAIAEAGGQQALSLGRMLVARTQALPFATEPPVAAYARLEDGIDFLGYGLSDCSGSPVSVLRPGAALTLDLYWRARDKISKDYTVFAHLVGQAYNPASAGPVWAGHDGQPVSEGFPTTQWFPNQVILDRHLLTLDPQAPAGDYELEVGMYLLQTMERLSLLGSSGQKRMVLGHLPLIQP